MTGKIQLTTLKIKPPTTDISVHYGRGLIKKSTILPYSSDIPARRLISAMVARAKLSACSMVGASE